MSGWLRVVLVVAAAEFAVGFGVGTWMVLSGNVPDVLAWAAR